MGIAVGFLLAALHWPGRRIPHRDEQIGPHIARKTLDEVRVTV
jgi:hypothetical protein